MQRRADEERVQVADARVEEQAAHRQVAGAKHVLAIAAGRAGLHDAHEGIDGDSGMLAAVTPPSADMGLLCYTAPMGLMDFFSSEGRAARSLQKHIARAKNKDSQHVDRQASLDMLRDAAHDGVAEAMSGLLGRFTIRYDKSIEDEQEKEFVAEELIQPGRHGPAASCRSICATPSRSPGA